MTMQLLPAATGVLSLQAVLVLNATRAKSPVVPMFVIVRADVPEFRTVTFFEPDVTPTRILPHLRDVGVRVTTAPFAVTVSCRVV